MTAPTLEWYREQSEHNRGIYELLQATSPAARTTEGRRAVLPGLAQGRPPAGQAGGAGARAPP